MGYERDTTPFLSDPPCEQIIFDNAIAPSSWTLPSIAGLHTGEFFNDYPTKMSEKHELACQEINRRTTIAETLSEQGWNTAAFSPNPHASRNAGFDAGFAQFESYHNASDSVLPGLFNTIAQFAASKEGFTVSSKQLDDIISYTNDTDEPFFIWSFSLDTHIPFQIDRQSRKFSKKFHEYTTNLYAWNEIGGEGGYGRTTFSEHTRKKLINLYDDSIRSVDTFIESLWKQLQEYDPIIIVVGDHGEGFGRHGYYSHARELYEELTHVPLTILNAGLEGKVKEIFSLLDLKKLIDSISNGSVGFHDLPTRDLAISKVFDRETRIISVRTTNSKYIWRSNGKCELYNISKDSIEQNNIVGESDSSVFENLVSSIRLSEERDLIRYVSAELEHF